MLVLARSSGGHDMIRVLVAEDSDTTRAINLRHLEIHRDQVGLKPARHLDRLKSIPRFADDID